VVQPSVETGVEPLVEVLIKGLGPLKVKTLLRLKWKIIFKFWHGILKFYFKLKIQYSNLEPWLGVRRTKLLPEAVQRLHFEVENYI